MNIVKCDLCKKEIKEKPITAGFGYWSKAELCDKCGLPIINFLKKHKFIKPEKNKVETN